MGLLGIYLTFFNSIFHELVDENSKILFQSVDNKKRHRHAILHASRLQECSKRKSDTVVQFQNNKFNELFPVLTQKYACKHLKAKRKFFTVWQFCFAALMKERTMKNTSCVSTKRNSSKPKKGWAMAKRATSPNGDKERQE